MEKKNENIDRYFRERLEKLEQQPSEANWNAIAEKLGHRRKKGMALLIFRIAAGMAILISTGIGIYLATDREDSPAPVVLTGNNDGITNKNPIDQEKPGNNTVVAVPEKRLTEPDVPQTIEYGNQVYTGTTTIADAAEAKMFALTDPEVVTNNIADAELAFKPVGITDNRTQFTIPGSLPTSLKRSTVSPASSLTSEEATALLLSDLQNGFEPEVVKRDRWVMGGEIAPLYSYRKIASETLQNDQINELNDAETGLLTYAGGISIAFAGGKRLSVQSGIYYSRYGQGKNSNESYVSGYDEYSLADDNNGRYISITNSTGVISSNHPESTGYDKIISSSFSERSDLTNLNSFLGANNTNNSASEETDITLTQLFDYLELPLLVKYKVIDRKIDFSFSGGIITNFLVGNKVNIKQNGETSRFGETKGIDQINYQGSIGLGLEYPITSGFAFTVEPRFRYYLNTIDNSSQINVHPYSFGFFAGLSYIF